MTLNKIHAARELAKVWKSFQIIVMRVMFCKGPVNENRFVYIFAETVTFEGRGNGFKYQYLCQFICYFTV